ncbi:MAG: YqaJ viral recombinase family protein [Sphingomonadales bacterium]|jgi:putative phage-type endonuclease
MKVVELDQRSEEWHKWRQSGVGASEAPILLNKGYRTPYKLWEEKCGYQERSTFMNAAMEHGINAEPIARQWANSHASCNCSPLCVEDEDLPFLKASLDGWDSEQRTLMEIKCPTSEKKLDHVRSGLIPEEWVIQMQWQMMICRPTRALLVVWDYRYQIAMIVEQYADENMIDELRKEARKFWDRVRLASAPPLLKEDYKSVVGDEVHALLEEYWEAKQIEKQVKAKMSELKTKIKDFGDGESFDAYGFKVSPTAGRKCYDIEQMRLDGIDVEKYAKVSSTKDSWTIRVPKRFE